MDMFLYLPYFTCQITENKCGGEEQTTKRHLPQPKSRKMGKAQNKRLTRRTTVEPNSAMCRPPLGLLPELFKFLQFAFRFEFEQRCPAKMS
jgi:hypothetical protein